jgi:hypothetical protein
VLMYWRGPAVTYPSRQPSHQRRVRERERQTVSETLDYILTIGVIRVPDEGDINNVRNVGYQLHTDTVDRPRRIGDINVQL